MDLAELKNNIPEFGRDIRLNLETVLTSEGAPGLTPAQLWGVALVCAYSLGSRPLVEMIGEQSEGALDDAAVEAAKAAATIMAMNNVYYRSVHLLNDPEILKLPARLRMSVIGKPGVPKVDFELMCFALSALAGCGQCLTAHLHALLKDGFGKESAQSALRIASVLHAADRALKIKEIS
jgi:alkyl hydroperoxide reductase subunit D